jgi:hypothetical protein
MYHDGVVRVWQQVGFADGGPPWPRFYRGLPIPMEDLFLGAEIWERTRCRSPRS